MQHTDPTPGITYRPLDGHVVCVPVRAKRSSLLALPTAAQGAMKMENRICRVIAVGEPHRASDGALIEPKVKAGEYVVLALATEIYPTGPDGKQIIIAPHRGVVCILDGFKEETEEDVKQQFAAARLGTNGTGAGAIAHAAGQ